MSNAIIGKRAIELAKDLGLDTKNLRAFDLRVRRDEVVTIEAEYVTDGPMFESFVRKYAVVLKAEGGE